MLFRSLETRKNSTVLPTAAILRGPQGTFVYAVKADQTVEARNVGISLTEGDITVITSGVNVGDSVVTDGQDKLQTGSKIELRSNSPGSAAGGSHSGNSTSGAANSGKSSSGTQPSGTPAP